MHTYSLVTLFQASQICTLHFPSALIPNVSVVFLVEVSDLSFLHCVDRKDVRPIRTTATYLQWFCAETCGRRKPRDCLTQLHLQNRRWNGRGSLWPKFMYHIPNLCNTHTTVFTALFRDYPGEPVSEEIIFWTLWCKGRYQTQTLQQSGCASCRNPPNLSWLGTSTKYAGLHTQWLVKCVITSN